jgi:hypothetical protein
LQFRGEEFAAALVDFEPFGVALQGQTSPHETLVERLGERLDLDSPLVEGGRRPELFRLIY